MFLLHLSLIVLAILNVTHSLALNEKINPVDLKYTCIHVVTEDGKQEKDEKPEKSPVLLLHAIAEHRGSWDGVNQVLAFRTHRRVCTVDLRNHGESPWDNRTDVEAVTADIKHILDQHNVKKVNLIGHGLGGKVAVHYALNNPDRVDSIVVEEMRPNGATEEGILFIQSVMKIVRDSIKSVPEGANEEEAKKSMFNYIDEELKKSGSPETLEERDLRLIAIHLVNGKWQFKCNIDALVESTLKPDNTLTESKGLYSGPALFIYGTKSPFKVGEDKDNILKLFPNAKMEPIEGAAYTIHGRFHKFDDAVIKVLNEVK